MSIVSFLLIFLGGGLGSCLRVYLGFLLAGSSISFAGISSSSLGVLLVNTFGGFLAGLFITVFSKTDYMGIFLILGFLGGFTTFSSFSLDVLEAARAGKWLLFMSIILANNLFAIAGAGIGFRFSPF